MKTKIKVLFGIGGALVLSTILYYSLRKKTDVIIVPIIDPINPVGTPNFMQNAPPLVNAPVSSVGFPLKRSNTVNENVRLMQTSLRTRLNQLSVASDGLFGPITNAAVLAVGYAVPVSKLDFDKIIAGIKK